MPDITATDAARNFSEVLDAIEHRGEGFTIRRRGKVVARLEPATGGRGAAVNALLRRHRADRGWRKDLDAVGGLLEIDDRE